MQLVAYGAQDVYLTGNPQITFWKVTYRRHTNFAMESIEQTFNGQADFGRRVTCTVSRNGDLAYRTYLQVTLPEVSQTDAKHARWLDCPGEQLIQQVLDHPNVNVFGELLDMPSVQEVCCHTQGASSRAKLVTRHQKPTLR